MTTTMDKDPVTRGDTVYDLVHGSGVVTLLYAGGRGTVKFSLKNTSRTVDFTTGTLVGSQARSVYWSPPVIMAPPKDRKVYDDFQEVVSAMAALVMK